MKKNEVNKIVTDESLSKSKRMILLYDEGFSIKEVSELMGVRYNFVYNVVSNKCRMNGVDIRKSVVVSKKMMIIELIKEGKSNNEICIELKSSYNYVYNVRKEMEAELV